MVQVSHRDRGKMARRSPQTERLVEIVEFLAAHADQGYRLADLARLVGMDKSTCYPMLVELVRVGWLTKDPANKAYRLEPRFKQLSAPIVDPSQLEAVARPALLQACDRG
jgi:DNA-binding IclR family transcriptional regulator